MRHLLFDCLATSICRFVRSEVNRCMRQPRGRLFIVLRVGEKRDSIHFAGECSCVHFIGL